MGYFEAQFLHFLTSKPSIKAANLQLELATDLFIFSVPRLLQFCDLCSIEFVELCEGELERKFKETILACFKIEVRHLSWRIDEKARKP